MKKNKRIIALLLAMAMLLCFCACGSKKENSSAPEETPAAESTPAPAEETAAPDEGLISDEDIKALESIGDVEVVDGVLTVSVTVPADLVGETTQEELDANAGKLYQSAVLNDDGSVTYTMTDEQYQAKLDDLTETIDKEFQSMVDDDTNSFTSIEHNDDFTQIDCTLSSDSVGFSESFSVVSFFFYAGLYAIFAGNRGAGITVNYYGPDGALLFTQSSGDSAA